MNMTLCVVVPEGYEDYQTILFDSIARNFKVLTKIIVSKPQCYGDEVFKEKPSILLKKYNLHNIEVEEYETPINRKEHGHALGLHDCIDKIDSGYVFFSDPDVFYCSAVDEFYLNIKNKYKLDYIGCSHHSAVANAYAYFPYLMSSLVEKQHLPNDDFLRGELKFRHGSIMADSELTPENDDYEDATGKYLISSALPNHYKKFPNLKPQVLYDTGVNLCLWSMQNNWKWLSFQTGDCHTYTTNYFRGGNFKLTDRLPKQKLLWHSVRSGAELMSEKYEEYKNDITN